MNRKTLTFAGAAVLAVAALFGLQYAGAAFAAAKPVTTAGGVELHDVETQTVEFMRWNDEIELTPAQERVRVEALSAIPAPCCSDNTAATCCCPCGEVGLGPVKVPHHREGRRGRGGPQGRPGLVPLHQPGRILRRRLLHRRLQPGVPRQRLRRHAPGAADLLIP